MLKVQTQTVEEMGDSTCNTIKSGCRIIFLPSPSKLLFTNCININLTKHLIIQEESVVSEGPKRLGEITLEGSICNTRCLLNFPIMAKRQASSRGEGTRYLRR